MLCSDQLELYQKGHVDPILEENDLADDADPIAVLVDGEMGPMNGKFVDCDFQSRPQCTHLFRDSGRFCYFTWTIVSAEHDVKHLFALK